MTKVGAAGPLSKRSVVVDLLALREWLRLGRFRTESEAIRAAVAQAIAIERMKDAVESIQRRRTFGRPGR